MAVTRIISKPMQQFIRACKAGVVEAGSKLETQTAKGTKITLSCNDVGKDVIYIQKQVKQGDRKLTSLFSFRGEELKPLHSFLESTPRGYINYFRNGNTLKGKGSFYGGGGYFGFIGSPYNPEVAGELASRF